jgi:hypothetical protein
MATGQLWLFAPPQPFVYLFSGGVMEWLNTYPLVERFGNELFRTLPTGPGVYFLLILS